MTTDEHAEEIVIDDEDIAEVPALPVPKEGETIDWEAEAKKFQGMATRRGTKLTKVKNAKKPAEETPKPDAQAPKKGEIGYAEKAYLNSLGYKDAEDHAFVQGAMKDTGKSLEDTLASPYVQGELKRMGEERATKAAIPPADGRQGAPARDSVEFWLAKGELPPHDQPKLRQAVVNAKLAKAKGQSQFSDTPVVGSA